jgi:Zn-dependent protease with chaperone function
MNFGRFAAIVATAGCLALQFPLPLAAVAPRTGPAPRVAPRIVIRTAAIQAPQSSFDPDSAQAEKQAYSLPPAKLAKAIALDRIRILIDLGGALWGLAVIWLLLATRSASGLERLVQRVSHRRWLQGLLFFAAFLLLTTLADLPLDIYAHHVSRSYGISVEGWAAWLIDVGKGLGMTVLLGPPMLLFFNWIVRWSPRRFWVWAWVVTIPLMLIATFAEPLAEPIFNQYEPLARNHPALVAELEKLVARTGTNIPADRMFLMKASAKTNGLNAYVTGIGSTKRIVVWDTTAGRVPDDEVLFLFGHETGHYVLDHIPKGLAAGAVGIFFLYWACAGLAGWLARRYGARWGLKGWQDGASMLSTRTGFVVLIFVLSVADFVTSPVSNGVSRHFEHQADVYGQEAIHGLVPDPQKTTVAAFNALGEAWLEDPNPNPFIEFWSYSHPSTQHRATFAAHYDPWANGGHGEFFAR